MLTLMDVLAEIEDPRAEDNRSHLLIDILSIALCSVICGGDGWEDMEDFGIGRKDWLQTFLQPWWPCGPSHFGRLAASIP